MVNDWDLNSIQKVLRNCGCEGEEANFKQNFLTTNPLKGQEQREKVRKLSVSQTSVDNDP